MKKKFVYIIGPTGGPFKVGISEDCKSRRSLLNVGNHLYLRLWYCYEAADESEARTIERNIHYQYESHHIRGEWFNLKEDDLPGIKRSIQFSSAMEYDLNGWSLARKSCDEFTSQVCAKARRALNLSEDELASKAGISKGALIAFESGYSVSHIDTLEALKHAFESEGVEFVSVQPGTPLKVLL